MAKKKEHVIKKLSPCIKGYGKYAMLSVLTVTAESILEIYIPYLMADLIDKGIPLAEQGNISFIVTQGLLMIGFALLSLIFGTMSARFASIASTGFATNLRSKIFNKIERFSFANIDKFSTASLVTRLTSDITNVQMAFQMCIRICVRAPVMLVAATVMAIKINAELAIIFAFALPVLAGGLMFMSLKAFPRFKKMLKGYDEMEAGVQENLIGIRVVKAFVRGDFERKRFYDRSDAVRKAQISAEKILILGNPMSQLVLYACMIAVCAIGGNQIIHGTMTAGELTTFISYVSQILMSVIMICMIFVNLVLTRASFSRLIEIVDEEIDITDETADENLKVADGSVEFRNVCFKYDRSDKSENVLDNINIKINPGETVGIIGGTGSAKSSLVQLIPRLYDVTEGSVLVGGKDVREYKLKELRNAVSMVLQKNVLFSGTIKENLLWGDKNATDEEIMAAAKHAQAHDFIMSFPNGYDTDLGQGGVNVSGGQKQRLCIARALIKKPKVIILDDSTSAVDTATDLKIRNALRDELKDTTAIIIAQRIASVMEADKIIVLNDGRIDSVGTHDELMRSSEIYREVYNSQMNKEVG